MDCDLSHNNPIEVNPRETINLLRIRQNPKKITIKESSSSSETQFSKENVEDNLGSGQIISTDNESGVEDELLDESKPAKK